MSSQTTTAPDRKHQPQGEAPRAEQQEKNLHQPRPTRNPDPHEHPQNHWKHTQTPACRKHPETRPNHTHDTHGDTGTTHKTPQNNQTTARHTSIQPHKSPVSQLTTEPHAVSEPRQSHNACDLHQQHSRYICASRSNTHAHACHVHPSHTGTAHHTPLGNKAPSSTPHKPTTGQSLEWPS
ncbi:hypothetical protein SAMN02745589_1777 [Bifidobacterium merycicum DSM 6492]|nr:hypothetical protein SAMN02745589_1777 [Bifidobacterium merycicum DSM 6492]